MNGIHGWYSAIQYASKAGERVNVGVLLHVPVTGQLVVRFAPFRRRLRAHADDATVDFIAQEVDSLSEWTRLHAGRINRVDLDKSLAHESGIVRFQPLRAIRMTDVDQDVNRLSRELLGEPDDANVIRERRIDQVLQRLDDKLRPLEEEHRLHFRTRVRIPGFDIVMPVHYQYRNGMDTYVVAEIFSGHRRQVYDRASTLAVRGRQLANESNGHSRLAVIMCYDDSEARLVSEDRLSELFSEHGVHVIHDAQVDEFVRELHAHAQPWF